MAITIEHWVHPETQPARARRTHSKVKTGCLTCKIRRKKCDEARPSCQRCVTTGRRCDGYAPPSPADTNSPTTTSCSDSTPASKSQKALSKRNRGLELGVSRNLDLFGKTSSASDIELHSFTYFVHNTIPQFASYFHAATWRSDVVRSVLALYHPTLFAAAVALGAVHRRFSLGICPEAFVWCKHASELQQKAVLGLQQLKKELGGNLDWSTGAIGVSDRDVMVISEMFLGMFQGFQDDYEASAEHVNTSLKLLLRRDRPLRLIHREMWHCQQAAKPRVLCQLVHRLYCNAVSLWGTPIKVLLPCNPGGNQDPHVLDAMPAVSHAFENLEEARDHLFTQIDWLMHTPARTEVSSERRAQVHTLHVDRLTAWSAACNRTSENCRKTSRDAAQRTLLSLARSAAYLMLCVNLFAGVREPDWLAPQLPVLFTIDIGPSILDHDVEPLTHAARHLWQAVREAWQRGLATHLADLKDMVEQMLNEHIIFQFDDPWLNTMNDEKFSDEVDNLADYFVDRIGFRPVKEAITNVVPWNLLGVYGIAGQMSAMQERAMIEALRDVIPAHVDRRWADITCMSEDRRQVLLRYYSPDDLGGGLWWTQEWWAF